MVTCTVGIFDDGWLAALSVFDVCDVRSIAFDVFLNASETVDKSKLVTIMVGTDIHQIEVLRGRVNRIGQYFLGGADTRIALDVETPEPAAALDRRSLGLKLVRVIVDGEEVDSSSLTKSRTQAVGVTQGAVSGAGWNGSEQSPTTKPTEDGIGLEERL